MKYSFYLFAVLGFCTFLSCKLDKVDDNTPVILPVFEKHVIFDSNKFVNVESVVEAIDGGYLVSGQASDMGFSFYNLFLLKTDTSGNVEKKVTDFGTFNAVTGGYLIKVSDGYIVAGTEYDGTDYQVIVCKFKTDLSPVWTKIFGKLDHEENAGGIETTAGGDIIVAASNGILGTSFADPFFLKIRSSDGMLLDSQTIDIPNTGIFLPKSIGRNGNQFGVLGYNFGISIPFPFFMKIDEALTGLVPFKSLTALGDAGVIVAGSNGGFVRIDGVFAQFTRQAYIESLDGNGEQIASFDQFAEIPDNGFLGGSRTPEGKYVACGWGADQLGTDSRGIAALIRADLSTEQTYAFSATGKLVEFTASNSVSDGGFILAGAYDNGKEILLVKLNDKFKLN